MSLRALRGIAVPVLATALMTVGAGVATTVVSTTAAYAESTYTMESEFIAKMNAARQASGLHPYAVASDLTSIARAHSQNMSSKQSLYHNPSLTSEVHNWQAVGENVGEGPDVADIHTAFMNSPEHRANILDHDFTQVGVGVSVDKGGTVWVTEDFREPMSTTPAPSRPAHHTSSPTQHTSSTPSTSQSTWTPSTGSTSSAPTTRPRSAPSPRAVLLHRLHQLSHEPAGRASDPVVQAYDYVAAVSRLTG